MEITFTQKCMNYKRKWNSWKRCPGMFLKLILRNPLSSSPTKWSNTLKQYVGCCRRIFWLCLTISWVGAQKVKNCSYFIPVTRPARNVKVKRKNSFRGEKKQLQRQLLSVVQHASNWMIIWVDHNSLG